MHFTFKKLNMLKHESNRGCKMYEIEASQSFKKVSVGPFDGLEGNFKDAVWRFWLLVVIAVGVEGNSIAVDLAKEQHM